MQIIDTFLFSEPHEKETLLIKFILGDKHIQEWIIVENEYSFQGDFKGVFAKQVIDSDERFTPFRDRIHIISASMKHPPLDYSRKDIDTQGMDSERRQRSLAREYIINKYPEDTWVLLSDADEAIDFDSNPENYNLLLAKCQTNSDGMVFVPRRRFWYDFDNLWLAIRSTPLVTVSKLKEASADMAMGFLRSDHIGYSDEWERTLVFEYSYCYEKENILRKFRTFPHGGMTDTEIEKSMRCNHIPISTFRAKKIDLHPELWMEKVVLNVDNSPEYVRQHIDSLRTNVINIDYEAQRKIEYPDLFTFKHKVTFLVKRTLKKILKSLKFVA